MFFLDQEVVEVAAVLDKELHKVGHALAWRQAAGRLLAPELGGASHGGAVPDVHKYMDIKS